MYESLCLETDLLGEYGHESRLRFDFLLERIRRGLDSNVQPWELRKHVIYYVSGTIKNLPGSTGAPSWISESFTISKELLPGNCFKMIFPVS